MGVKSTRYLTRREAEAAYLRSVNDVSMLSNIDLENILEQINDRNKNGEGFENYIILNEDCDNLIKNEREQYGTPSILD